MHLLFAGAKQALIINFILCSMKLFLHRISCYHNHHALPCVRYIPEDLWHQCILLRCVLYTPGIIYTTGPTVPVYYVTHTHDVIIIYSGDDTARIQNDSLCASAVTNNWATIISSINDSTSFANELKTAGLIPEPVFKTATDRKTAWSTEERVTDLLSSAEPAIRKKEAFLKFCEILAKVGDKELADDLQKVIRR